MNIHKIDYNKVPYFSATDVAYATQNPALRPFYHYEFSLDSFRDIIEEKSFESAKRQVLVEALSKQYQSIPCSSTVQDQLQLLAKKNCYTVVTAHQPNLCTGPLYTLYKIISAINLAKQLAQKYTDSYFVPVFWMGGEDHDFEEVNHFKLFGRKMQWQDAQGGAVGQYNTASLRPLLEEIKTIIGGGGYGSELAQQIDQYFEGNPSYATAVRRWIHDLFSKDGLLILDASKTVFKQQMLAVFKDDILHHSSKALLENTATALAAAGFKKQAHARPINLFYSTPNRRDRIVSDGDSYEVLGTSIRFSRTALLEELEKHPEKFSPNVILRPIFQETILPNIAYVGGGGELAYWLERKAQFEFYNMKLPVLVRRCSVLWINKNQATRMRKLGIEVKDLMQPIDIIIKKYLKGQSNELSLEGEWESFNTIFNAIIEKSSRIDKSLEKSVLAQRAQLKKSLDKLESKMIRAEKRKNETSLAQIRKIINTLFPDNSMQERKDNFLEYFCQHGSFFIDTLKKHLDPLDTRLIVIEQNELSS